MSSSAKPCGIALDTISSGECYDDGGEPIADREEQGLMTASMDAPAWTKPLKKQHRTRMLQLGFGIGLFGFFVYLILHSSSELVRDPLDRLRGLMKSDNSKVELDVPPGTEALWSLGAVPEFFSPSSSSSRLQSYAMDPFSFPVQNAADRGHYIENKRISFLGADKGSYSELVGLLGAISKRNKVNVTMHQFSAASAEKMTREKANEWWKKQGPAECNGTAFDMLVIVNMALGRPHLQNCCNLPTVVHLTNRFDLGLHGDADWAKTLQDVSSQIHVRIHPNNLLEPWYANNHASNKIVMGAYLPFAGIRNPTWAEQLLESYVRWNNTYTLPEDDSIAVLEGSGSKECLSTELKRRKTSYQAWKANKYGGPLGLTDRIVAHIPRQSGDAELFDNLSQRVIYLLPSMRLYKQLQKDANSGGCSAGIENVPAEEITESLMLERIDWWRRDLQHLFYYFDSFDDLRNGSYFLRHVQATADAKRAHIASYMVRQREYALRYWEDLIFGGWAYQRLADQHCVPDIVPPPPADRP